ncbi:hypothetical protein M231_00759 [Tremella mesenterica]|uniref:Uncharacterized protein n=1 Tax=Tremella mesenterica TaxID=5217 RepID=A0A4Q1BVD6_TREME|nr:uncharacterized protein TREMEDRAFT_61933 [Tremella mesenterica DSM 1558]EIW70171.1 hypothetical protein TREMEDRAFT_61933 [Tremella mesenterica DSM 1558]RXK42038.1 hypothetical protein M231_00759 [Tremella mesenterica]
MSRQPERRLSNPPELLTMDYPASAAHAIVKHGKYIVLGGLGCWWTDMYGVGKRVWEEERWMKSVLGLAMILHALTITIFLYLVLFLPYIRGYIPNYPEWQKSTRLRFLVPTLTSSIFVGWCSFVLALTQGGDGLSGRRHMGMISAMAGSTAFFAFTLGCLGMIPSPRGVPIRRKTP